MIVFRLRCEAPWFPHILWSLSAGSLLLSSGILFFPQTLFPSLKRKILAMEVALNLLTIPPNHQPSQNCGLGLWLSYLSFRLRAVQISYFGYQIVLFFVYLRYRNHPWFHILIMKVQPLLIFLFFSQLLQYLQGMLAFQEGFMRTWIIFEFWYPVFVLLASQFVRLYHPSAYSRLATYQNLYQASIFLYNR